MIFLNAEETISFDQEKREICKPDGSIFLSNDKQWDVFIFLLKNEGKECLTVEIERDIGKYDSDNKAIATYINRFKKYLIKYDIPCISIDEKDKIDPDKITIKNKRNRIVQGKRTGSYTLYLPKIKNKNEKILANLFWKRYENLSAQKEGENKNNEIVARIGEVYQFPLLQENGTDCIWSLKNIGEGNQNIVIEAPNGYGKSTFMRSILLSSLYQFIDDLSEKEKENYGKIYKFHDIPDESLFIYLECKEIQINKLPGLGFFEFLYDQESAYCFCFRSDASNTSLIAAPGATIGNTLPDESITQSISTGVFDASAFAKHSANSSLVVAPMS